MQGAELDEKDSRLLWIAVIENAIRDSMLTKRTVRQSARDWLLADQQDFPYVCELAGLDDVHLRKLVTARFRASSSPIALAPPCEQSPISAPELISSTEHAPLHELPSESQIAFSFVSPPATL